MKTLKVPKIPNEPLIFATGLIVGSLVTWLAVKKHYSDRLQKEIDSAKEVYAQINQRAIEKAAAAKNKPDISTYVQSVLGAEEEKKDEEVTSIPYPEASEPEDDDDYYEEPIIQPVLYEIEPMEFASYDNNNTRVTIMYFTDGIYADERYDKIDPRQYFSKDLVLLDDNSHVRVMDYVRKMVKDEICIRDAELGIDIDLVTKGRPYSDYM